jgi:hypothetical protein
MNLELERRLRQQRSRVLVRSWEYRQRRHARGAWYRLRRALAAAVEAYVVSPGVARQLLAEGYRPESVGAEFHPPKLIVFVESARVSQIPEAQSVPVRLGVELLAAEHLILVPFAKPPRVRA